jgi:tripartite-type tricarboxylate transporter receptor subunit TctC
MLKIIAGALAAVLALPQVEAKAQAWPSKPIKFVLPFGAGSATDALARITGQEWSRRQHLCPGVDGNLRRQQPHPARGGPLQVGA